MIFQSKLAYYISLFVSLVSIIVFAYIGFSAFFIAKNQFIDIDGATYVNQVRTDDFTKNLALHLSKNCQDDLCKVQKMLDFVTAIPYKENHFVARSPKNTVEQNFGDCDDKSNLLISMLKVSGYESYFVTVPKHIFVIVKLQDSRLKNTKGLYINGEKYYILESTAKGSKVGFELKYKLDDISAVIDPFINKKLKINSMEYKL
ncbi:transglutaminase domain-containing protein [Arcobacter sp. FWKO B]|uniref:transglutaminase domain-containing protein n=1 Tax=Arcobacter sp. FWKO B TaxID=2593672 RepID=UPI0018A631C5|nr:transglutaminase domain-containing protein [Arcobacter sp. FWKO B]QOG12457.1 transglutaminase domain-containing protein [Arcobacter sp. FWKO B]